jgi:hypothetical protein
MIDNWLAYMVGVFGYGFAQINLHLSDAALKFFVSMFTAAIAGGMGYVGKLIMVWSIRKVKTFIHSKPKK